MAAPDTARLITSRPCHIGLLLLATSLCYVAGLNSVFLFDDGPNLDALIHIRDTPLFSADFWEFVLAGQAGPTGRPLSLFTFALQASSWPDNPVAFKGVNLLIHCLSAVLVYLISAKLATVLHADHRRACLVAATVSLIWALHPVHTSTVLYAVQRMALLSNFFILLGVYCHVLGRLGPVATDSGRQLVFLTLSLAATGLLALFSKENAPSLVFYLLALEYTLLREVPAGRQFKHWRTLFLWLPALVLLVLPLVFLESLREGYENNFSFTMTERLLTQSRVLWDYLGILLLPSMAGIGIFRDVPVSTSLLNPASTLAALLAWGGLLALAVWKPGRHRTGLFALLWFWAGHSVESTLLPLEMYFHHRNYLAFFGLVFILVFAFYTWSPNTFLRGNRRVMVAGLYLVLLAFNTFRVSTLWANPLQLAERWYEAEPATSRNAEFYARELAAYGGAGEVLAAAVLEQAARDNEDSLRLLVSYATLACVNADIVAPAPDYLLRETGNLSPESRGLVSPVQQIVNLRLQGNCPAYSTTFMAEFLTRLIDNTQGYDKGMYQYQLARVRNSQGETETALQLMESAYENSGDAGILFNRSVQLINAGDYPQALATIDRAIADITENNNIRTGTRSSKLETLNGMREDVLGFMVEGP